jgi:hypothetical protein
MDRYSQFYLPAEITLKILCSLTSSADLSSLIRVSRMFHNVFLGFKSDIFEVLRNIIPPDCINDLYCGYRATSIRHYTDADEIRPTLEKKDACELFHFYAAVERFGLDYINRGQLRHSDILFLRNKINPAPQMFFRLFFDEFLWPRANLQVTKPQRLLQGRRRPRSVNSLIEAPRQLEDLALKAL